MQLKVIKITIIIKSENIFDAIKMFTVNMILLGSIHHDPLGLVI